MAHWKLSVRMARKLSKELRRSEDSSLRQRRGVVGLSLVGMGAMGLITLYQMGIIKHLPEPPLPRMNADKVDASADAYQMLATPDAAFGLASYAGTIVLASMQGSDRAQAAPWIPLTLAVKVAADAAVAAKLTANQWTRQRAFCFWCLTGAGATFATLPLVLPEAYTALRRLRQ